MQTQITQTIFSFYKSLFLRFSAEIDIIYCKKPEFFLLQVRHSLKFCHTMFWSKKAMAGTAPTLIKVRMTLFLLF